MNEASMLMLDWQSQISLILQKLKNSYEQAIVMMEKWAKWWQHLGRDCSYGYRTSHSVIQTGCDDVIIACLPLSEVSSVLMKYFCKAGPWNWEIYRKIIKSNHIIIRI